ncbi:alpha/beta fold hydrolase [Pseudonocardia sp. CA-107938]|uniref:alpha/beta fold hydrolase n=1 Tax=Pseudonocardia sp. CA-107938 TaxID=3240021 RepID=UPI003D94A9CB
MPVVQLSRGPVHYTDAGSGPVVVLIHGLLVNGTLWDGVAPLLAREHRVLVPDLPLGSHREAMRPDADLSPAGLAAHIAEFLDALDLQDVTLVGNDTGGALCQITAADHSKRLARLVLTNCDAYDNFLPPAFRPVQLLPRIPGALWLTAKLIHTRVAKASFDVLVTGRIPADLYAGWTAHASDAGVRHDVGKVLRGITVRETQRAIAALRRSAPATLLVWGDADPFFKPPFARRLAADIPGARLEWVPGARTFVPIDRPERVAELVAEHVRTAAPA